jgi:hypothetical protein
VLAAVLSSACVPRTYPTTPLDVRRLGPDKWTAMREPGWFKLMMPAAPTVGETGMDSPWGRFLLKTVTAQVAAERFSIYYAAPSQVPQDDQLFKAAHDAWAAGRGVTITSERWTTRDGLASFELELQLAPDSEYNGAPEPAISRVVLIREGARYFQLGYVVLVKKDDPSRAARFFDSLRIER